MDNKEGKADGSRNRLIYSNTGEERLKTHKKDTEHEKEKRERERGVVEKESQLTVSSRVPNHPCNNEQWWPCDDLVSVIRDSKHVAPATSRR